MRQLLVKVGIILLVASVAAGCGTKVTRTDRDRVIDLSGRWNDTDSRLVSEEMVSDCFSRPWINRFNDQYARPPVMITGTVTNRSHEHINTQLFTKDLERAMLNSGLTRVVASKQEREEVRDERRSQQEGLTSTETVRAIGQETGADFMLQGSINTVKDAVKGKYVILYQINLELIDLTNNEKVWIGQKEIKKYVTRSSFSL